MNQYGESDLVNNPRYQGQSGGTNVRGPEGESRYGAMPMSTGTGNPPHDPLEPIRNPAAYGFKKDEPEGFRYPGTAGVTGAPQQNLVEPNAHPSQAGYSSSQLGYGQHQDLRPGNQSQNPLRDDFAKEQPGYGQPGFGAPSQGQNTGSLWPTPAAPPNAHRSDVVGQGYGAPREGMVDRAKDAVGVGPNSGYDNRRNDPGYDTQGYGAPREGMVDRAKDAVGVGPNSGYDNRRDEPGYGTQGYDQPREGMVDRAKDAVGVGPNSGYDNRRNQPGYDNYGNPRREGVVDKMEDSVGMGPNTGRPNYDDSQEYNPNVNHPSEVRGFGGGLGQPQGTNTGYDQSQNLGSGYDNRMATGADAYGQPRREGMVDRMKDSVGVGPNSGYDDRTRTGSDAYVHGNHPAGMQDRITGVNEPTMQDLSGDMNLPAGQHVPPSVLGERRTEPGYDMSTGHLSDKLGGHHTSQGVGTGRHGTDYDERRGKGFEDTAGAYDHTNTGSGVDNYDHTNTGSGVDNYDHTNTGLGVDNYDHTNTGSGVDNYDHTNTGSGVDNYDGTNTGSGVDNYDGTNTGTVSGYDNTGTGTAPPKKGLMTKIKEKIHHTH